METIDTYLVSAAFLMWCIIVLLPWCPWSRAPTWDADPSTQSGKPDLEEITVLIPARNEEALIPRTLKSLASQGPGLKVILVDDQSTDHTVQLARQMIARHLTVISGESMPEGWSGKLWALDQGFRHVHSRYTLLMDADIELQPGTVAGLCRQMRISHLQFISLMAVPHMGHFWEKLLMPAFIYFFKLLYPFHLANSPRTTLAAAAGGCILLETRLLHEIGGFAAFKDALIDDCALARRIKSRGYRTWLGLTHSVRSLRPYQRPGELWDMVARTAFTQLKYSPWLLGLCTLLMLVGFAIPVVGLLYSTPVIQCLAAATLIIMMATYVPVLRFYGRTPVWALAMPLIGILYLAMTWSSAIRYWRGERSRWKGRKYGRNPEITI